MKKLLILVLAAVFALSFGHTLFAKGEGKMKTEGGQTFVTKAGEMTWRASEMIGMKVENKKGEDLGKISDLAVDPRTNRVAFAVLSHGGAAGVGDKLVAVPMRSLTLGEKRDGGHVMILDMNKEKLDKAPTFSKDSWPDKKHAEESYRYFGQRPYWETGRTAGRSPERSTKKTY